MQITEVSPKALYRIENIFPKEMEQRLADLNMHDIEFELEEGQEQRPRRSLIPNDLLNEAISYIQSHIPKLNEVTGRRFRHSKTRFWVDQEQFDMDPHIDNPALQCAMQIFLIHKRNLGTNFYNNHGLLCNFPHFANTGYLMINNEHQLHGPENRVPIGDVRFSSYTTFKIL